MYFGYTHPHFSSSLGNKGISADMLIDIKVVSRTDGALRMTIHRTDAWSYQHLRFSFFTLMSCKLGFVRIFYHLVRNTYSIDMLNEEEGFLQEILERNN